MCMLAVLEIISGFDLPRYWKTEWVTVNVNDFVLPSVVTGKLY